MDPNPCLVSFFSLREEKLQHHSRVHFLLMLKSAHWKLRKGRLIIGNHLYRHVQHVDQTRQQIPLAVYRCDMCIK